MKFLLVALTLTFQSAAYATPPEITRGVPPAITPAKISAPASDPVSPPRDGPMCSVPEIDSGNPSYLTVLLQEPATPFESALVSVQLDQCSRKARKVADPFLLLAMLRLEDDLGVPPSARGIFGAAWCWEAAFRAVPRVGDEGRSHGIFQMGAWFWSRCNLPVAPHVVYDIPTAARCYASVVQHFLDDGKCPGNYARAEAMAANGRKYHQIATGRASFFKDEAKKSAAYCSVRSLHWEELMRWSPHLSHVLWEPKAPARRVTAGDNQ